MKIGDTIRRTSMWGDVVTREIKSDAEIKNYKDMQRDGFTLEVLVGKEFVPVPKLIIHRARPTGCSACES